MVSNMSRVSTRHHESASRQCHDLLKGRKRNILHIIIDDLRNELGAYRQRHMSTPFMDQLAREGLVFDRAYCQAAHCVPSRSSFLSGRRPEIGRTITPYPISHWMAGSFRSTAVRGREWTCVTGASNVCCSLPWDLAAIGPRCLCQVPRSISGERRSLPGHFLKHGWHVYGGGKIFHSFESGEIGRSFSRERKYFACDDCYQACPNSPSMSTWYRTPTLISCIATGMPSPSRMYPLHPSATNVQQMCTTFGSQVCA